MYTRSKSITLQLKKRSIEPSLQAEFMATRPRSIPIKHPVYGQLASLISPGAAGFFQAPKEATLTSLLRKGKRFIDPTDGTKSKSVARGLEFKPG